MEMVLLKTIKKYNLFENNSTIIVAVSGGADSMALLYFLSNRLAQYNLRIVVAHVNHKKRRASELDEILVKAVAEQYHLPCEIYHLPKDENIDNFHVYARMKRYEFFKLLAENYKASCIVTAHHADDHLETLIHRFLYYNTASSLIGIEPISWQDDYKIVRPFIEITKEEIYNYCDTMKIRFREDESNESDVYTRNRIRKNIVSTLVKESPTIYKHAREISEQLSEDERYFSEKVTKLMNQVTKAEDTFEVSRTLITGLPESLARRLIKRILQAFTLRDITSMHIDELLKLIKNPKPNLTMKLPHEIVCIIAYESVKFSTIIPDYLPYNFKLELNSRLKLSNHSEIITKYGKDVLKTEKSCINKVYLCYNELDLPLKVRTRIPGDRIALKNNHGNKKVKEIMIESKIPKHLRDQWPIVTDAKDQIIWIPLLKKSHYCKEILAEDTITIEYVQHGRNEENA